MPAPCTSARAGRESGSVTTLHRILLYLGLAAALLALLSTAAVYSYGRFVRGALGEPGHALPVAADETLFDRIVAPLTAARPGQSGMALLDDNVAAFALRAFAAREAGRSLDLQYYIWHADRTGTLLLRELLRAADRGVRVRLLLDDVNAQDKDASLLALDRHPLIEVRLFNPGRNRDGVWLRAVELLLRAVSLNRRMHNKAWIADGRVAIVGGRNIGDEYFDASGRVNFQDTDLMLVGPAVEQTSAIFDAFWNSRAVIPIAALHPSTPAEPLEALRARLDAAAGQAPDSPWVQSLTGPGGVAARLTGRQPLTWSERVRVVSDPPEKASPVAAGQSREHWLLNELLPLVGEARREALLVSPYFVPGEEGSRWLAQRVQEGVDVRVLTNSLAATDVALVHAGYSRYRRPLLDGGIRIHELKAVQRTRIGLVGSSGASLHTKAMVVDGLHGFVGSFNIDPRSAQLNTEMGVLFSDEELAGRLRRMFLRFSGPEASYRLQNGGDGLRWIDGEGPGARTWTHDPETGFWRRALIAVMRWLPIESQL